MSWSVCIHGGAGQIDKGMSGDLKEEYLGALNRILDEAASALKGGGSALDVVEVACQRLEDFPLFNAGKGATLDVNGNCCLEASIMCDDKSCGSAAGLYRIKNPIKLARLVMEKTPHVMLISEGAHKFAETQGLQIVDNDYFKTERKVTGWIEKKAEHLPSTPGCGTIGCVARDVHGRMVAGTSTGGRLMKMEGRVGDSPTIGSGTYSNSLAAISCTGMGELFMKNCVAYQVVARMEFAGQSLEEATKSVMKAFPEGTGGLIAVDSHNNISAVFNTLGMFRASASSSGQRCVGIWDKEEK